MTNQRTSATADYYRRPVTEPAPTLTSNTRLWHFTEGAADEAG